MKALAALLLIILIVLAAGTLPALLDGWQTYANAADQIAETPATVEDPLDVTADLINCIASGFTDCYR